MENAPIIPETLDDDKDDKDKKSKKKSHKGYGLAGLTFELDNKEGKDDKKEKSWFSFLEKDEDKKDSKEDNKPEKEVESEGDLRAEPVSTVIARESSPEVHESEAPVEEISETEAAEIRPKIVEAIETVEKEGESDPATDAPVEEFREIVKETGDADKAYEQVLSELDSDPEEAGTLLEPEEASGENIENDQIESEPESEEELQFDDELHEGDEILFNAPETSPESAFEEPAEDNPESSDDLNTNASAGTPTVGSPASSSSAGGGSAPPRVPPSPPFGTFGGATPPPAGPNFNVAPVFAAANPNTAPQPQEPEYYYGASPAAMALFGGIIGYLIGRRRGRIKTEKKLIPIQKKLERQVEDLRFDIQEKEKAIRRVAAEKIKSEGPAIIERFKETKRELGEKPSRIKAPEATELHGSSKRPERIGHVIVTKETVSEARLSKQETSSQKEETKTAQKNIEINRDVETLSRNELLEIGNKIIVNGTSLRQIYESHLIGERGLRRLVHEHLRGGDMGKALKMEIAERELDFERDPLLRDMNPHQYSGGNGGASPANGGQAALEHLLKKADAALEDTSEEAAYYKARAAYESKQHQKKQQNRKVLDVSLAVVITSLIAVILYLLITRV